MKTVLLPFLVCCLPLMAVSAGVPPAPAPLDAYVIAGSSFAEDNHLGRLGWTEAQQEAFIAGVRAALQGTPRALDPAARELIAEIGRRMQEQELEQNRRQFGTEAFAQPGYLEAYLKEASSRFSLESSDSGLHFGIKARGTGSRPGPDDMVVISYKANAADFNTELPGIGGQRLKVRIRDLLPGLAEAVQMMTTGSSALLVLPPDLSYGTGEWPAGVDRGTPLAITLVLHEIVMAP